LGLSTDLHPGQHFHICLRMGITDIRTDSQTAQFHVWANLFALAHPQNKRLLTAEWYTLLG
jgi:hypothetical protein